MSVPENYVEVTEGEIRKGDYIVWLDFKEEAWADGLIGTKIVYLIGKNIYDRRIRVYRLSPEINKCGLRIECSKCIILPSRCYFRPKEIL